MSYLIDGTKYSYPEWDSEQGELPNGSELFLSDSRGIYIPQHFAESVDFENTRFISREDWDTLLSGPDHEWYWEAWSAVENEGVLVSPKTKQPYAIYQDGDCWLVPLTRE